jgi:hypothetical protein
VPRFVDGSRSQRHHVRGSLTERDKNKSGIAVSWQYSRGESEGRAVGSLDRHRQLAALGHFNVWEVVVKYNLRSAIPVMYLRS